MNVRPIKGHTNLETLKKVIFNLGEMTDTDLDQQLHWLASGIKAARAKICRAQDDLKAVKFILKHRQSHPECVIKQALRNKSEAEQRLYEAELERDQFLNNYRNFRSISYIRKSMALILPE